MSYQRVLPRDLFNEANLLKCLGQIALLAHEGKLKMKIVYGEHGADVEGFDIQQQQDGDLYVENMLFYVGEEEFLLSCSYNAKDSAYPLHFTRACPEVSEEETGLALDEKGQPTPEFLKFLELLADSEEEITGVRP